VRQKFSAPESPECLTDLRIAVRTTVAKLNLPIDSSVLTRLLDDVRTIRNDVMHFDPDPMTADQLATLKQAARFMQELFGLLP
jgi:hypothetical protein